MGTQSLVWLELSPTGGEPGIQRASPGVMLVSCMDPYSENHRLPVSSCLFEVFLFPLRTDPLQPLS